jgi:hypothetical protein
VADQLFNVVLGWVAGLLVALLLSPLLFAGIGVAPTVVVYGHSVLAVSAVGLVRFGRA